MGVTITEEAPNFTSPGNSDRTQWVCGLGQAAPLRGSLGAGCLASLVDKGLDGGGQVQGQWGDNGEAVGEWGITCQLGRVNVQNDGCQPVRAQGGGGISG